MKRPVALMVLLCHGAMLAAQFEVGISAGGYVYELWEYNRQTGRASAAFASDQRFPWTATLHYRGGPKAFRFATDLQYMRREFFANYTGGGLGSGYGYKVDVRLDMLYWGILPELRIAGNEHFVLRFGPRFGWVLNSNKRGTYNSWSQGSPGSTPPSNSTIVIDQRATDFKGDIRLLVGLGFRFPVGERTVLTIDPYWGSTLTSMLKGDIGVRGHDGGVQVGLSTMRVSSFRPLKSLWRAIRAGAPVK